MSSADDGAKQKFELYIKASAIDKETKGSCPICQHWFMITCLLGEYQDDIDFKVYTVQADCPPKNFGVDQGWSKKFPVVMVLEGHDKRGQDLSGTKYDTFEELELFFESINKESRELKRKNAPNVAAMKAVEDVYTAFNGFIAGKGPKRLKAELKKVNEFLLDEDDSKFLVDDVLSFADCYLLPRLQHIRVAGKAYMDFDIPEEYTAIWKYLAEAYKTEAFRSTMPSDQDIIVHYEKKVSSAAKKPKFMARPTLQNFTYTLDIPEDIAASLAATTANTNGDVSEPITDGLSQIDISHQPPSDAPVEETVERHEDVVEADGMASAGSDDVVTGDSVVQEEVAGQDEVVMSEAAVHDDTAVQVVSEASACEAAPDVVKDESDVQEDVQDDNGIPGNDVKDDDGIPGTDVKDDGIPGNDVKDDDVPQTESVEDNSVPVDVKEDDGITQDLVQDDNGAAGDVKEGDGVVDDAVKQEEVVTGDSVTEKGEEVVKVEDDVNAVQNVAEDGEKSTEAEVAVKVEDADDVKEGAQ